MGLALLFSSMLEGILRTGLHECLKANHSFRLLSLLEIFGKRGFLTGCTASVAS